MSNLSNSVSSYTSEIMKNIVLTKYREKKLGLDVIVIQKLSQRAWVNGFLAQFGVGPKFGASLKFHVDLRSSSNWRVTVSGELMFLESYGNCDVTNTVTLLL